MANKAKHLRFVLGIIVKAVVVVVVVFEVCMRSTTTSEMRYFPGAIAPILANLSVRDNGVSVRRHQGLTNGSHVMDVGLVWNIVQECY